jgi:uncharacterized protein (TIGR02001 family)
MKMILRIAASVWGAAAASTWASPALATEGLTANGAITTDYIFRGITQSAKRPALQAGLDYSIPDSNFAAGTWVSSINFGDDTNLEWDIFANYKFSLGALGASAGVVGYVYPYSGNGGPYDFAELTAGTDYDFGIFAWSAKAFWAPALPRSFVTLRNGYHPHSEYFLTTGVSVPVDPWLALSGNFGFQHFSHGPTGIPNDAYMVWDIGATVTVDKYSLDLRYTDTDKHTFASYLDRQFATGPFYVATLSFKFP